MNTYLSRQNATHGLCMSEHKLKCSSPGLKKLNIRLNDDKAIPKLQTLRTSDKDIIGYATHISPTDRKRWDICSNTQKDDFIQNRKKEGDPYDSSGHDASLGGMVRNKESTTIARNGWYGHIHFDHSCLVSSQGEYQMTRARLKEPKGFHLFLNHALEAYHDWNHSET